jgi:hypothetical protein
MTYTSWGHGNCAGLPSLTNYKKAKEWFDSVTPIRGRTPAVRPLGNNRRFTWYEIRKNQRVIDDGFLGQYSTTYSCTLYNNMDCVEFYPDGKIAIRTNGWRTPTSMAFINYVTREFGFIESVGGKWYWKQRHDKKMFLMSKDKDFTLMLKPDANNKNDMVVDSPTQERKYAVSRKAMNAVRKKYAFFSEYCHVMLSMNDTVHRDEVENVYKSLGFEGSNLIGSEAWRTEDRTKRNREIFFKHMDKVEREGDVELMYSLAILASYSFGHWSYINNLCVCTPAKFNSHWSELLKYAFFNEVMVANEVEAGVGFKDPNTKYL